MKNEKQKTKKAVALKYPEGAAAPFIVAKGKDKIAELILEEAEKNNIKIEHNGPLVDFLSVQELGSYVPEETWEILAEIFSLILKFQEK